MNRFSALHLGLDVYKGKIDKLVQEFLDKDKKNQGIYNDTTYAAHHAELVATYRDKFAKLQNEITERANNEFDWIQSGLRKWMSTPCKQETLSMISAVKQFGLKLSIDEVELLRDAAGPSYLAQRLIDDLAISSKVFTKRRANIDNYTNMLKGCINQAEIFIKGYCGRNLEGKELLPADVPDWILFVAPQAQVLGSKSNLLSAAAVWDGDGIPVQKKTVGKDEMEILEKLYDGTAGEDSMKVRTAELVQENGELRDIISKFPKYAAYLPEEETPVYP